MWEVISKKRTTSYYSKSVIQSILSMMEYVIRKQFKLQKKNTFVVFLGHRYCVIQGRRIHSNGKLIDSQVVSYHQLYIFGIKPLTS